VAETSGGPGLPRDGHPAAAHTDPDSARAAVSRAKFLSGATIGLGAVIGAAVGIPVLGFVLGPSFEGEDWYWANLGPADSPTWEEGTYVPVVYTREPDGGNLQRRVAFVRRNAAGGENQEPFTLVSNVCMHLGCPVVGTNVGFGCPCHGGQYDTEGRRTAGPPVRPLNRFEYKVENGNLFIGRAFATKEVDGEVVVTDIWKDPGQPTTGLLSYLYPPPPR
jgi:Rieske Fe-S protein